MQGPWIDWVLAKTICKNEMMQALTKVMNHQEVYPEEMHTAKPQAYDPLGSLSRREKEIAMWVAKGYTSAYIAEKLNLSLLTVNTHRRNIMRKLDIKHKVQLAGLVDARKK